MTEKVAIVTITRQGLEVARRLLTGMPEAELYVSAKYAAEVSGDRVHIFDGNVKTLTAGLFKTTEGLIYIMAAGIVVRTIAEFIQDKKYDPGVVVMDLKGRFAISLISGHLGGANDLARRAAEVVGGTPVITTGTDTMETIAPDLLAKEIGGEIEDFGPLKTVSAALVDSERVGVVNLSGVRVKTLEGDLKKNILLLPSLVALREAGCKAAILISHRVPAAEELAGLPVTVTIRPKTLAVGIGCNRDTPIEEFEAAVPAILAEHRLAMKSVRVLATIDVKRDEAGLLAFARRRGLPIEFFDKAEIEAAGPLPNPSETVAKFVGVKGVCEPAALLASGGGRLIVEKVKRGNLTLAIAEWRGTSPDP